ncbi:MAG: hypothetical protein ABJJ44_03155 [Paraglaciecola sp.]|uniref:hypothetical protein n=1 Tax=Paraglaciecola sp. TaxID=1920173 RepID=UPI003296ACC1
MNKMHPNKMDDEYITQNDIIHKYLHNKLTPEEVMAFEEYIMDKPHLLEQLELDSVMVETIPLVNESNGNNASRAQSPKPSFWDVLFGTPLKASLGTGLACALVIVLLLPNMQSSTTPAIGNLELFYLSDVRSNDYEQKFAVAKSAETLIFVLEAEFEQITPFTVSLTNESTGQPIFTNIPYTPSDVGEIYVPVSVQDMPKGNYQFEYYPANNQSKLQSSRLTIDD